MVTVISLGGSIIVPQGVDTAFLKDFKAAIENYLKNNKKNKIILVTGGGSVARTYQNAAKEIDPSLDNDKLDWIGVRATRINAELVNSIFGDLAKDEIVTDPTSDYNFTGRVLIASGWKPGFSTDTDAVYLAKRFSADTVINLSNIKKVYTADPNLDSTATPIDKINWAEFRKIVGDTWVAGKNLPFDPIASKLASEAKIKVICGDGRNIENTLNILNGKDFIGTTIGPF